MGPGYGGRHAASRPQRQAAAPSPPQRRTGVGLDRAAPRRAPATSACSQTGHDAPDESGRGGLAMHARAVRLRDLALAGDTLPLASGLPPGLPRGADGATAAPPLRGAIRLGAAVRARGDEASPASGEAEAGRWGARRCQVGLGSRRTGLTPRCAQQPGQGLGVWGGVWGRRLSEARGGWGRGRGCAGHPTWLRRQRRPRAPTRSGSNNRGGAMTRSACTGMQAAHGPACARSCMCRYIAIHDR